MQITCGAAMAPAAFDTLITHFEDTGRKPSYYDAIITGDLGHVGKDILQDLCKTKGYNINANYDDCGVLIFDKQKQDSEIFFSEMKENWNKKKEDLEQEIEKFIEKQNEKINI